MKNKVFVYVGSTDGVLTTAAHLNHFGSGTLVPTEAHRVNAIQLENWSVGSEVYLVDLAVNNRDAQVTVDFLARVNTAGHTVVSICDEHDGEAWQSVWLEVYGNLDGFNSLIIQPRSQNTQAEKSSGAVMIQQVDNLSDHAIKLCQQADQADQMDFSGAMASVTNASMKASIKDDTRRDYLVNHFATNQEPDFTIESWVAEYEGILLTHQQIVEAATYPADHIVRIDCTDKKVDMTTLMKTLYDQGNKVVILQGRMYNPLSLRQDVQVSFGTNASLDLMNAIKAVGVVPNGGFGQKVNVQVGDEAKAMKAVIALLS